MKVTEVEIFGGTYAIKGDADPEYVMQLARYVDEKMKTLARKAPSTSSAQRIAVLTALNIADELFIMKKRQAELDEMMDKKTGDLFKMLDEG